MSGARVRAPLHLCECAHDHSPHRRPHGGVKRGVPHHHTELARTTDLRECGMVGAFNCMYERATVRRSALGC